MVFLDLFLSLEFNVKHRESSSESDGSDRDESEELEDEEELDEDGSVSVLYIRLNPLSALFSEL